MWSIRYSAIGKRCGGQGICEVVAPSEPFASFRLRPDVLYICSHSHSKWQLNRKTRRNQDNWHHLHHQSHSDHLRHELKSLYELMSFSNFTFVHVEPLFKTAALFSHFPWLQRRHTITLNYIAAAALTFVSHLGISPSPRVKVIQPLWLTSLATAFSTTTTTTGGGGCLLVNSFINI